MDEVHCYLPLPPNSRELNESLLLLRKAHDYTSKSIYI
jgi:hypothetical protein